MKKVLCLLIVLVAATSCAAFLTVPATTRSTPAPKKTVVVTSRQTQKIEKKETKQQAKVQKQQEKAKAKEVKEQQKQQKR